MIAVFIPKRFANLAGDFLDESEVNFAAQERSSYGDEGKLGFENGAAKIGRRLQAAANVLAQQRLKPGLENWGDTLLNFLDLLRVGVHTDNFVALFSQTNAADQPNVSGADDGDSHYASSATRFPAYQISERRRPSSIWILGS